MATVATTAPSTSITRMAGRAMRAIRWPVEAEATTINISGTGTLTAGQSTTLTATVENGSGDTLWGCEETSWRTTGTQVTFTANEPGTYHIHAVNNGADSVFVLTVSAAATPEPTAVPTPMPEPTSADSTPQ